MKHRVVLYNPRAVFWTMPLALIAVGSALDRGRYEVQIVDGRLEADPVRALLDRLDESTLCLGVTVLTGAPIRDALAVSRAVKAARPNLPVIWGGWHPSLFPEQCLAEAAVDAVVIGQGEDPFAEIVARLAAGEGPGGVAGCVARGPAPLRDLNHLPAHDYELIDVEGYFRHKSRRQFDYISSQGCRFRCTFCADPTVYLRGWYGLAPERMTSELAEHHRRYRFTEISFQDETFFTSRAWVEAIARAFLASRLEVGWTATMRADQGARLDDDLLRLCNRSGLRRVMIGVESGSPEVLRRIEKDITLEQVFASAEKCARHGIGAILNFIVGFPGESDESVEQTLDVAARLRAISPNFEASIFYYRPYPGNPIADELERSGYRFPTTLEGWAGFDYLGGRGEWVTKEQWQRVECFKFYQRHAYGHNRQRGMGMPRLRRLLSRLSRWRVERRFYAFPLEKALVERLRPAPGLS